jgi:hypothetical protein
MKYKQRDKPGCSPVLQELSFSSKTCIKILRITVKSGIETNLLQPYYGVRIMTPVSRRKMRFKLQDKIHVYPKPKGRVLL